MRPAVTEALAAQDKALADSKKAPAPTVEKRHQ